MKTKSNFVLYYAAALCIIILSGCNPDSKLLESINEYESKNTNSFFPTGKFIFDENVSDMHVGKITIDMLKQLQNEELITLTVNANEGSKYAVEIGLTDKGKQYAKESGNKNVYIVTLYNCKAGKILEKQLNEDAKAGSCVYSLLYNEVTPFGKIMNGAEPGKVYKEKNRQTLKKIDGTWQVETFG